MDVFTSARASSLDVSPDLAWGRLVAGGPGAHWYLDALPLMLRATLDRLLGGEPLVRPPDGVLAAGDRAGFWTVEHAEDGCLLMVVRVKAPGSVRIGCELTPEKGGTRFRQEVIFHPGGPLGVGYLLADLPAREVLIQLLHSRTRRELIGQVGPLPAHRP